MLDLKTIREAPEAALAALARRGPDAVERLRQALELDQKRRRLLPESEQIKARQNAVGEQIAKAKAGGGANGAGVAAEEALAEMKQIAAEGKRVKERLAEVEERLAAAQAQLPNLPHPDAADEDTVLREVGTSERLESGRDHVELAGGLIDMEAGARVSGARFAFVKGDLVQLELALVQYAISKLGGEGFTPVIPPVLTRERALFGTGFMPDTEQQIYRLADDDLYLVGTSEVSLASLHDGEILDAADLPLRYCGYSPCFRREAGAAGKDTQGIFRVHQFEKVEMFVFCAPERAAEEHERLLAIEESIMRDLGIPYRVVNIAVGELGPSAAMKYDVEAWLPGQRRYRELTSCSNTTDFQMRRLNTRAREAGKSTFFPHTLNGTATALGRTMIAILENHQDNAGVVMIPEVLHAFGAPRSIGEKC